MFKWLHKHTIRILSLGTYPGMDENKKLVIQVSTFVGLWAALTMLVHVFYTIAMKQHPLPYIHGIGFLVESFGIWLVFKRHYDLGRVIIYYTGLSQIVLGFDLLGPEGGYDFFYVINITLPFITFTLEERWKGFVLSISALILMIVQVSLGPGLFLDMLPASENNRLMVIISVMIFVISAMSVSRWQLALVQEDIKRQQAEFNHNANLISLGEMSAGIAHEINNPLQILSLHNASLHRYLRKSENTPPKVFDQLIVIDKTITKISNMIIGLRSLSRNVSSDPLQVFTMAKVIEDVMNISSARLSNLGVEIIINDKSLNSVKGHSVQFSQVLINLMNNSIDAIAEETEKWIEIDAQDEHDTVKISFTDSGNGIPMSILNKIMQPFFTTKEPGKGTGLGLSISKSIIEKNGGKFYYDEHSRHTRFVIALPVAEKN